MSIAIIVEGKNDKSKLHKVLMPEVEVYCTYGTPGSKQLQHLGQKLKKSEIFIFTDNDSSGRKIRALLADLFPDAEHIYTRKGYKGVENTPLEYIVQQLEKAGLAEFIIDESPRPASEWSKEDF